MKSIRKDIRHADLNLNNTGLPEYETVTLLCAPNKYAATQNTKSWAIPTA